MIFNLFGGKKVGGNEEAIAKKMKSSLITPYTDNDSGVFKTDDGIDIVVGDSLKKSKYSFELSEQTTNNPQ